MVPQLVSVIVLNYNGERIIRKCLDHLLAQTYARYEIIVVDNNSADGSLSILEEYLVHENISVIKSERNLGVSGGRNLGLQYVRGDIIGFMDNDGYATPTWLEEVVETFRSDETIGAVASLVFFNKRKSILNGAGGTINFQGYGGDWCFNSPYEFARIPDKVLYPMGCGMVVRRSVMAEIGAFDPFLFNYYDDTELGIKVWKSGFQVAVSPNGWIDHDFSFSDQQLNNKVYLCERNRIRTVLKYYPLAKLLSWLLREWYLLRYLKSDSLWSIPFRAWGWNLMHLPSALKRRIRFSSRTHSFWHLLHSSWGGFPPAFPNNQSFRPDIRRAGNSLLFDDIANDEMLNFGWYYPEMDGLVNYRWAGPLASALFRVECSVSTLSLDVRMPFLGQEVVGFVRPLESVEPRCEISFVGGSTTWERVDCVCNLEAGVHELLLFTKQVYHDSTGRALGVAVSLIRFH